MSGDDPHDDGAPGVSTTLIRDPVIGTEVSGYRVTARLGSGGMGVVYEGEQPLIGKRVAIKVLRHEIAENPELVLRLVAEARAVNQVGHRGIIDVFGVGKLPDGRQCIVMELLDGEPLEAVMRAFQVQQRVMPLLDALTVLEEVFSALAAAHTAGVIHRDLKPSNIFLCRQRDGTRFVKLLDFGIAKLGVLGATPATRASMMVGTPGYMAPEQASGGTVTPAMDLYAAGVVTFELLTGRLPFESENVMEMLVKHASQAPPSMLTVNPTLPTALDGLVQQLLAKQPEARPRSAEDVRLQVVRVRAELMVDARQSTVFVDSRAPSGAHAAVPLAPAPARAETNEEAASPPLEVQRPGGARVAAGALALVTAAVVGGLVVSGAFSRTGAPPPSPAPARAADEPAVAGAPVGEPALRGPDVGAVPAVAAPVIGATAGGGATTPAAMTASAPPPGGPPPAPVPVAARADRPIGPAPARPGSNVRAGPDRASASAATPAAPTARATLEKTLRRIEANLGRAEAQGEDVSSQRREVVLVRKKLATASPDEVERLTFRLGELEAESAP
ncbi:MAG: serine/threonine-protein kinase [Myxococcaceae bacterium]|nr:serine/threonine-protein kinase [Myxococcaceae bacterium]